MSVSPSVTADSLVPKTSAGVGIVDIHAHFLPACYRGALDRAGLATLDGGMPIPDWSADAALSLMDRHGIATAILSVSSPGLNFVEAAAEPALAREINRAAADLVATHRGRFGAFATLPVGDIEASLLEIDYALDTLGLDGFILETNHGGIYPGDPAFAPILAKLNSRHAVVLLHPTSPACLSCLSSGRPAPLIEFPFETTRALVDLLYSGALARHPDIRFILAHAGGVLPFLAQRVAGFTRVLPEASGGLDPAAVGAQLARLYYDTALSATPIQIAGLREIAPLSQILFGSDWPFSPEPMLEGSLTALNAMPSLDADERSAILGGNARKLLPRHAH